MRRSRLYCHRCGFETDDSEEFIQHDCDRVLGNTKSEEDAP
jgi:hypothetical protein